MRPTEQDFFNDVATHEMAVLLDEGTHRHLRFAKPGTMVAHFDLVTYPGYLCYSGDMGCFVFSRVPDMFTFFRTPEDRRIDFSYWAEKLNAQDVPVGARVYSPGEFVGNVRNYLTDIEASGDLRRAVVEEVENCANDGEHEARRAALQFEWEGKRVFTDFWEMDCRVYTYRFLWACRAIAWGIRQYDAENAA